MNWLNRSREIAQLAGSYAGRRLINNESKKILAAFTADESLISERVLGG